MTYDANIAGALVGAISELDDPPMDAVNPHFKNKYATLKSCLDTVRPALARHGLVMMQFVMPSANGGDRLVTRILHESGGFMEDEGISLVGADNMQKLGSAISYARRYGLLAILGLVGDPDDDAEVASAAPPHRPPLAKPKPVPVPVVADDIPFDKSDEREDLIVWSNDAKKSLWRIKNTAELKSWATLNKETLSNLQIQEPDAAKALLVVFENRKRELNNA
jgi:hypothetical protein|tara:strand:- start:137 stop:802 length:666 start_codon:yes stop_codon:yes gene_type:complete